MEQIVLTVEYNGRRLSVWREDAHGYSRFFVTPLCVFDTSSIKCLKDKYSIENQYTFSFYVRLWDSDAANIVQLALKQKGIDVPVSDIIPLPMQMVRLSINRNDMLSEVSTDRKLRSYQGQPNGILFELQVKSRKICDEMVNDSRSDPETFLAATKLYFEFTMFVGQESFRVINITGSSLTKSKFFAELVNDYSDKNDIVYLTSDDANNLARDIYRSLSIQDISSEDYIPSQEENQIIAELLGEIKGQQVFSSQLSENDWDSVFWKDVFLRPDIQTDYLKNVLTYDADKNHFKYDEIKDSEFKGKLEDQFGREIIEKISGSAEGSFKLIGGKVGANKEQHSNVNGEFINDTQTSNFTSIKKDELIDLLNINNALVKWTGEKFEPKGLTLQRINTKSMQSMGEIFCKRVVTKKVATTQELPLQVVPNFASKYCNGGSPVFYEALHKKINETTIELKKLLSQNFNDIQQVYANSTTQINDVRNEIKVAYDALILKLEETTAQINADLNSVKARSNDNRAVIDNHYNHHENRVNQLWGEIEWIKSKIWVMIHNIGYSCQMSTKCHADRLTPMN